MLTAVPCSDGVELAVADAGRSDGPVIVCIHGYPDDRSVWDGVASELEQSARVICYDIRGAGQSGAPKARSAYRLTQLVSDLLRVIDFASPYQRVHVVGHDWGSVLAWQAVTTQRAASKIASFTSISGPCLDHVSRWVQALAHGSATDRWLLMRQLMSSSYIPLFCLPVVPELLIRSGAMRWALAATARVTGDAAPASPSRKNGINGLRLYRANILRRHAYAGPRRTDVPIQVIAPIHDPYVHVDLATQAPLSWVPNLRIERVDGAHWVMLAKPRQIAGLIRTFVNEVESR